MTHSTATHMPLARMLVAKISDTTTQLPGPTPILKNAKYKASPRTVHASLTRDWNRKVMLTITKAAAIPKSW
jgi:hypothetical protein